MFLFNMCLCCPVCRYGSSVGMINGLSSPTDCVQAQETEKWRRPNNNNDDDNNKPVYEIIKLMNANQNFYAV
jgi:hypothetical protein